MKTLLSSVLALTLLGASALFGQTTDGNIVGTVLDSTGAGIPNASVELTNQATAVKATSKTDSTGAYRFGNVLIGLYTVSVNAQGFAPAALKDVRVDLNITATANISLQLGSVTTQVEVTEAAALLDTTTAQVSNTYETRLAAELPQATGSVLNLSLVSAGVASSGGVGVGTGPSVGGQRPRNNNFTVDGVDNNSRSVTGPVATVPNDSVAEFSVLQNQFSAEFGHSSGGQFNTVIKSGSNQLHLSLFEYLQNRDLNAVDQAYARQGILSNPRYDSNRFGGDAGAPIKKNRLFVYGLYEYNPTGQASTASAATYTPTAAGYSLLNSMPGLSQTNLKILEQYAAPAPTASSSVLVNGVTIPTGILPIVGPSFSNLYRYVLSSDLTISNSDQLRGRYIVNHQNSIDTSANLPVFFALQPTTAYLASVSEFHNFRPNITNEVRLAFNRYNSTTPGTDATYPGLDAFPNIVSRDLNLQIGPDPNAPQSTIQSTYQIVDNVSWTKGRHDIKFGTDLRNVKAAGTFVQRVRGDYEYTKLQYFLTDSNPDYIAQRNPGGKPYSGDLDASYWYVNDNYRWSPNFTLNLGLRYEYTGVAKSMKDFALNSIANVPGVITFQAPTTAKKNFAPRVGFAYSPGKSGNTSIRGGFGMAYDQVFDNVGLNARPPQDTSTVDVTGLNTPNFLATGGIPASAVPASFTAATARANTSSYLPGNQQLGYAINWNLGFQRVFKNDYTFEARYLGTKGVHLLFQEQINRNAAVTSTFNLPTFVNTPTAAQLASLTTTYADITNFRNNGGSNAGINPLAQYGFPNAITAYEPLGNSKYHGLALQLTKRYSKNLLFTGAYTWSHLTDDSTAEVASIVATPRRPQDFGNIRGDWASSALDHRNRFSFTSVYDLPWFSKDRNYLVKNVIGNWALSGTYIVETGELATPQSGVDSNQNGDSAADRVILNVNGTPGVGSDVIAINKLGQTVATGSATTAAYVAVNPNAQFIRAQVGAFPTTGRNIILTPRINNFDVALAKNIWLREKLKLQLRADTFNTLNHPQYILGRLDSVSLRNTSGSANWFIPGNPLFEQWNQSFSSNARNVQVTAKLTF